MFGTEISSFVFIIIIIQVVLLGIQIVILNLRPIDTTRMRMLILIVSYLSYNVVSGLLPDKNLDGYISPIWQMIFAYSSGVLLATSVGYYLYSEFDVPITKYINLKTFWLTLWTSFILFFVVPFVYTGEFEEARLLWITIPILITFVYGYEVVKTLRDEFIASKTQQYYRGRIIGSFFIVLSCGALLWMTFFGSPQIPEHLQVNIGFFIIYYFYLKDIIRESRTMWEIQTDKPNIENLFHGLTPREIEVVDLLLKNKTYKEIANEMLITEGTVSKHASNIFKKKGISNKSEFMSNFVNS